MKLFFFTNNDAFDYIKDIYNVTKDCYTFIKLVRKQTKVTCLH